MFWWCYFLQDEEKAKLIHSRLLELCRGVANEHVLYKYNIADPSIASLTSKPAKLVCQLYENYGAREPGTAHHPPGTGFVKKILSRQNNKLSEFARIEVDYSSWNLIYWQAVKKSKLPFL